MQTEAASLQESVGELNLTSTPINKRQPSSREFLAAFHQRDALLREKDDQIRRLTAALSAFGQDARILDKLIVKAQQMSNLLLEKDDLCQTLKRRVVSLDAKIHNLTYRPHYIDEVKNLRQQVRQQSEQLRVREERVTELTEEMKDKDEKLKLCDGFIERSSKYRKLLEERDDMCRSLLRRVSDLEAASSSMVPRRDYEAVCQRKRKAEEENAELRLQLKRLKAENETLTKQFDVIKSK